MKANPRNRTPPHTSQRTGRPAFSTASARSRRSGAYSGRTTVGQPPAGGFGGGPAIGSEPERATALGIERPPFIEVSHVRAVALIRRAFAPAPGAPPLGRRPPRAPRPVERAEVPAVCGRHHGAHGPAVAQPGAEAGEDRQEAPDRRAIACQSLDDRPQRDRRG